MLDYSMYLNKAEQKAYQKAYEENKKAQQKYHEMIVFATKSPEYRCLSEKQLERFEKNLCKQRHICEKAAARYIEVCNKYGIIPGSVV